MLPLRESKCGGFFKVSVRLMHLLQSKCICSDCNESSTMLCVCFKAQKNWQSLHAHAPGELEGRKFAACISLLWLVMSHACVGNALLLWFGSHKSLIVTDSSVLGRTRHIDASTNGHRCLVQD